jgi:regulator of RNase E activity RraA
MSKTSVGVQIERSMPARTAKNAVKAVIGLVIPLSCLLADVLLNSDEAAIADNHGVVVCRIGQH